MFFCTFAWIHGLRKLNQNRPSSLRVLLKTDFPGSWIRPSEPPSCLLQVYECLQRFLRDSPMPVLNHATAEMFQVRLPSAPGLLSSSASPFLLISTSGLWWLQLLIDVRSSESRSEDARELCRLLRQPHLQVRRIPAFQRFQKIDEICRVKDFRVLQKQEIWIFSRICGSFSSAHSR